MCMKEYIFNKVPPLIIYRVGIMTTVYRLQFSVNDYRKRESDYRNFPKRLQFLINDYSFYLNDERKTTGF